MIGSTISHFTILDKIASGGMGVLYRAEDNDLKRIVALKFLPSELTNDPEVRNRFVQEAQAASALDHPNICTVYEIGKTPDDLIFISMAYYSGSTLREKISKSGPLPVSEVLAIAKQIALGLHKAHSAGIIHRDVKPANIMITHDGLVKILDFGLAKLAGRTIDTQSKSTLGTIDYMSPEQARGDQVDHRTDIWSFGVGLYEMATGVLPFKGEYDQAVIYSILHLDPVPPTALSEHVPPDLETFIIKCLSRKPELRPRNCLELLLGIDDLIARQNHPDVKITQPEGSGVQSVFPDVQLSKTTRTKRLPNITGVWKGRSHDNTGRSSILFTLMQSGMDITGVCSSSSGWSGHIMGTMNGETGDFTMTPSNPEFCRYHAVATFRKGRSLGQYATIGCSVSISGTLELEKQ